MTKIDIISGFLGAGKTTLIKKLIEEGLKGQKVVLIENEFGEIGIDGGFLKESRFLTKALAMPMKMHMEHLILQKCRPLNTALKQHQSC